LVFDFGALIVYASAQNFWSLIFHLSWLYFCVMKEFRNNMDVKFERMVTKRKVDEYSTTVTFKPDLTKFEMTCLEKDVVALMKKRVLDMAGCLGVTVELNSEVIPFKSFKGYADFFLNCAQESKPFSLPRFVAIQICS
jgi:DNA topoisomerase II